MKVLIISNNPLSLSSNNGKTLNSIFSLFEEHEVCQLYFHSGEEPASKICQSFFRLSLKESILNWIKPTRKKGVLSSFNNQQKSITKRDKIIPSNNSYIYPILMIIRDLLWSFSRWYSHSLIDWLSKEKPTIIFFLAGNSGFSHTIALKLKKVLDIPLAIYFTDDYLLSPVKRNPIDKLLYFHLKKIYSKSVSISSMHFTVGELMSYEYSQYFKKKFLPIMNCVVMSNSVMPLLNNEKYLTIVYFGGLHLGRSEMILKFTDILSSINRKYSMDLSLSIYSSSNISNSVKSIFETNNIKFFGSIPSDQIPEVSRGYDCFLHVESDEKYYRSLTRMSVSTKIPEYLSLFRPIIAFGPSEVASMRLLFENNIGITISSDIENKEIESILYEFLTNFEQRKLIADNGLNYANAYFDIKKVSKTLKSQLLQLHAE